MSINRQHNLNSESSIRRRKQIKKKDMNIGSSSYKYAYAKKNVDSWGIFAKRGFTMKFGPYYSYEQCKEELDRLSKRNAFLEIRKLSWRYDKEIRFILRSICQTK